jgi:hypothetical protein
VLRADRAVGESIDIAAGANGSSITPADAASSWLFQLATSTEMGSTILSAVRTHRIVRARIYFGGDLAAGIRSRHAVNVHLPAPVL